MAIALPGELQESVGLGTNRALTAVCGRSAEYLKIIARTDVPCRALEGRFGCHVNCRNPRARVLTGP